MKKEYLYEIVNKYSILVDYIRTPGRKIQRAHQSVHIRLQKGQKVACAVITPEWKTRKRMRSQNTVYSAEQETIIKAIQSTKKSLKKRKA
jgi:hypothetical protein